MWLILIAVFAITCTTSWWLYDIYRLLCQRTETLFKALPANVPITYIELHALATVAILAYSKLELSPSECEWHVNRLLQQNRLHALVLKPEGPNAVWTAYYLKLAVTQVETPNA